MCRRTLSRKDIDESQGAVGHHVAQVLVFAVSVFAATILTAVWMPPAEAQAGPPMKLIQTIPLPKVEGYFDHMAVDIKANASLLQASTKGRWK